MSYANGSDYNMDTGKQLMKPGYGRSILLGALAGLGLALVFSAGFFMRDILGTESVSASDQQIVADAEGYPLLDEVQMLLDEHFLHEQPSYTQRQYDAIRGMLGGLGDRNTFFIDPPVTQSESDVLAGTYGGIGVNVQRNTAGEFILYPFVDSPAEDVGILSGDVLLSVNGQVVDLSTSSDVVDQMLRGEVKDGNGVELIYRRNDEETTVFVLFAVINVPSVQWRLLEQDNRIGYIQILRFTNRTPDEMREALDSLDSVDALVLDLRNNYGGLLREAIEVVSLFLEPGVAVYELTASGEEVYDTSTLPEAPDVPMVVLVNHGTASASELLAGAIQDRERGILIGQWTYGKGTIQQIYQLSDSSSIHITSAEWLTPNRNHIDGVGLHPDVEMIPDENGRDVEIEEALRYLQAQIGQ